MKHFAFLFFICPLFTSCIWIGVSNYTDAYDEHLSLRERISLLIYFLQEKSTQ